MKKSLPEEFRNKAEASLLTGLVSASLATLTCYPLDTVRRQMQMRGTPYKNVLDAIPGNFMVFLYMTVSNWHIDYQISCIILDIDNYKVLISVT